MHRRRKHAIGDSLVAARICRTINSDCHCHRITLPQQISPGLHYLWPLFSCQLAAVVADFVSLKRVEPHNQRCEWRPAQNCNSVSGEGGELNVDNSTL
jgi:hypothetical protein